MQQYVNPIDDSGDFADPFVLRHNGVYYLYCTHPRVLCWTSTDLVHWELKGPVIEEGVFPDEVPFAPEVVYADGWFHMYTSPHGKGHYVLRSRSPLGPFEKATGNIGRAIDGSVLIDDDGRWYFYWAGWEGIWACEMPSPTEFGEPVLTGAHMNGWTEGPSVIKRDGRYVMTLTANHFLSPGYRINVATSASPLTGFEDDPLNPVVLSADGPTVGLGHSSTTVGPDLVSTWMAYHSIRPDRIRQLNIDRMVWIDGSLQVLGPSWGAPVPTLADAECRWDVAGAVTQWTMPVGTVIDGQWALVPGGAATWQESFPNGPFTLEENVRAAHGARVEVAGGVDGLVIEIDAHAHTLNLGGKSIDLPAGYEHDALHLVRIEHDGATSTVYLDGRRITTTRGSLAGGRLTVSSEAQYALGHTALTRSVPALADRAAVKPVPGRFWAGLTDRPRPVGEHHPERSTLVPARGEASWVVHAANAGRQRVFAMGQFEPGVTLKLVTEQGPVPLRIAGRVASAEITLAAGPQPLVLKGGRTPSIIDLVEVRPFEEECAFIVRERGVTGYAKELLAPGHMRDVRVVADVWVDRSAQHGHGDVIFRASQLSLGYEGDDPRLGADFFLGYSLQLHGDKIVLARHDYDQKVLVQSTAPFHLGGVHHVVIEARGSHIEVEVDGRLGLSVEDPLPHVAGGVGLRAWESKIVAHELEVGVFH